MTRKLALGLVAVLVTLAVFAASAQASFGITDFSGSITDPDGQPLLQAGGHPDVTTTIEFSRVVEAGGEYVDGNVKDVEVDLPPGLVGNPTVTPKCSQAGLLGNGFVSQCVPESQVGIAHVAFCFFSCSSDVRGLYSLTPPPGVPAQFGFNYNGALVFVDAKLRNDGEYALQADVTGVSQGLPLGGTSLTFWGVPADPSHTAQRRAMGGFEGGAPSAAPRLPFMSNPTSCSGVPLTTTARADSWEQAGSFHSAGFDHDSEGNPLIITGCDSVPFEASFGTQPTTQAADSPTGLAVDVSLPQTQNPDGLSTADLKKAVVVLPAGMAVNPSSASGLGACSGDDIGLGSVKAPACPDSSKIGSIDLKTPLLEVPLQGSVYLAQQSKNPFGSLLAIYLVAEGDGIVVKLPGRIETDSQTGRVTARFDNNPQLPFEHLHVEFFGGPRASLVTPPTCGSYVTTAEFTPWSGTPPVGSSSSFRITSGPGGKQCPAGSFDPKLEAGASNGIAGDYSPFGLNVSREDGTERLSTITAKLPKGLLAKLKGTPYCPEAALAGIPTAEGTGAGQLASPACPAASQVATVSVGTGAGPGPFYVNTGRAYLAGPYKGAPLSLAIVTPALAGPFDLGNVVVRTALWVDPETAQVTAVSDPLPTILHGIPLDLRDVRVDVERPGFTRNPTSCDPMQVAATITGVGGGSAAPSDRFQVGSCERLKFAPRLSLQLKGGTARNDYQQLTAHLQAKKGEADIARVSVALPSSEFLAQNHINTVCTRVQFAADQCPKGSIYGYAEAKTPLLDKPLKGPVYLRSSSHPLPDLVAALKGQIEIDLSGRIDSVDGGIRTVFQAVPDAPVSSFTLRMKGGKKSLLVNSTDLCRQANRATVKMDGHNGKVHDFKPVVGNGCGG
jgi:hypothetical protein